MCHFLSRLVCCAAAFSVECASRHKNKTCSSQQAKVSATAFAAPATSTSSTHSGKVNVLLQCATTLIMPALRRLQVHYQSISVLPDLYTLLKKTGYRSTNIGRDGNGQRRFVAAFVAEKITICSSFLREERKTGQNKYLLLILHISNLRITVYF